jgi:hypothetical protein
MPINRAGAVQVKGLDDFRAKLKNHDNAKQFERDLKDVNWSVADYVAQRARPRMAAQAGGLGPAAAETLKATRSGVGSRINLGNGEVPWTLGVEFGANRGLPRKLSNRTVHGWNQFRSWRGSGPGAGYALFPTMRESEAHILDMYGDAVERLLSDAFPD